MRCFLTPAAPELGKRRPEGRVAKRFGYIIISATVFWAPLVYHPRAEHARGLQTETSENLLIMNDKTTFVTFSIDLLVCFFVSCLLRK